MSVSIEIQAQAEHQYIVLLREDDEVSEAWFTLTPSILDRLRRGDENEEHFVRRTAEFLVQRQGVTDFPDIVDLEDVLATYDDYVDYLDR